MSRSGLKPFFCYFGGKWRAAPRYPAPVYDTIIEPFAGAAGYATRYYDRNVRLIDANEKICAVWDYLIRVSQCEVLLLPIDVNDGVDSLSVSQEAKWLIGFWLNGGCASPRKSPSAWMRSGVSPTSYWGETIRYRIATQVDKIRHWTITLGSYDVAQDNVATWFVDPPYQFAGKAYPTKFNDFQSLAQFCKTRRGQVIVCEAFGANWLPFESIGHVKSANGIGRSGRSHEVMWTNVPK